MLGDPYRVKAEKLNRYVTQLQRLSKEIEYSMDANDFPKILKLDDERKDLLKILTERRLKDFSEADIQVIKDIAEHNEKIVANISELMSRHTMITSNKIKMLQAYNKN